jgi:predicted tellurium resistance membrane protein TerC
MTYFQTIKYTIIVFVFFFGTSLLAKTSCEKGTAILMAMAIASAPTEIVDYGRQLGHVGIRMIF